jgi:hypothetical protein
MSEIEGRSEYVRFTPELRGWAALRLVAAVPRAVRQDVENRARRGASNVVVNTPFATVALAAVSTPAAIAWSREVAERLPKLGPAAGPACLARVWMARLLRPDGALDVLWPAAVDGVWRVVRPILARLSVPVGGGYGEELRDEVAAPMALVFLESVAAGRKDLRLVDMGDADRPDGPPFGWAPGIDSLGTVIRYLVAGQVPGRFRSHALLSSPLARVLARAGLAVAVTTARWWCEGCGTSAESDVGRCPHCGELLALRRTQRLVPCGVLSMGGCRVACGVGQPVGGGSGRSGEGGLATDERLEAEAAHRICLGRARRLWKRIIIGRRANVRARVVLGALAGVQPLTAVGERPAPRRRWLERLVEVLAESRLDRPPLAGQASAAAPAVAARLGRAPPRIQASHVGVLAARFRRAIFTSAGSVRPG